MIKLKALNHTLACLHDSVMITVKFTVDVKYLILNSLAKALGSPCVLYRLFDIFWTAVKDFAYSVCCLDYWKSRFSHEFLPQVSVVFSPAPWKTDRHSFHHYLSWVLIEHFQVPKTLTFKMRPSAQPSLWKWVLFAWEWKILSTSKAEHLTSFCYRGPGELGMVYCLFMPVEFCCVNVTVPALFWALEIWAPTRRT